MRVVTLGRIGRALVMLALISVIVSAAAAEMGGVRNQPVPGDSRDLVVLVHGMGRSPVSMYLMERRLAAAGYRVLNWGYPSTGSSIPELGSDLARDLREQVGSAPAVHFVGHSLGNIIIRWMLAEAPPENPGRVVMIAPPNQGAKAADRYSRYVGWFLTPISELGTDSASLPRALPPPVGLEVGIIAGEQDGTVHVPETRLDGAREHVVVPAYHTFIMNRGDVQQMVLRFLRIGTFGESEAAAGEPVQLLGNRE